MGLQGKMGESEQILRRDLPPGQAERNLQWLCGRGQAALTQGATGDARTCASLQGG